MLDDDDPYGGRSQRNRDRMMDDEDPAGGRSQRNRDRMMNNADDDPYGARSHRHRRRIDGDVENDARSHRQRHRDDDEGASGACAPRHPHPRRIDESDEAYPALVQRHRRVEESDEVYGARVQRPRHRQRIDGDEPPHCSRRRQQFCAEDDASGCQSQRDLQQRMYDDDEDSDKYASTSSSRRPNDSARANRRRGGPDDDVLDKENAGLRADRRFNVRRWNTLPGVYAAHSVPTPHGRRDVPHGPPHCVPHLAEQPMTSVHSLERSVSSTGYDAASECRTIIPSCTSDDFSMYHQPPTVRRSRTLLELPSAQHDSRAHNTMVFPSMSTDTLERTPLCSKEQVVAQRASSSCASDMGSPCVARSVNSCVSTVTIPEGAPISIILPPAPSDMHAAPAVTSDGVHTHSTYKSFRRPKVDKSMIKEARDTSSTAMPGDNYDGRSSRMSYEYGEDVPSRDGRYGSMASSILSHTSSPRGHSSSSPRPITGCSSAERRIPHFRRSGRDGAAFPAFLPEENPQATNEGDATVAGNIMD
eukprot:GEMP01006905.1.p1 GENE.GEMP01006905.1~~GEMP01006905.1.p1  ORF type:complete len:531 (-),score=160.03 GEMP01006905.1:2158-3750(-)